MDTCTTMRFCMTTSNGSGSVFPKDGTLSRSSACHYRQGNTRGHNGCLERKQPGLLILQNQISLSIVPRGRGGEVSTPAYNPESTVTIQNKAMASLNHGLPGRVCKRTLARNGGVGCHDELFSGHGHGKHDEETSCVITEPYEARALVHVLFTANLWPISVS